MKEFRSFAKNIVGTAEEEGKMEFIFTKITFYMYRQAREQHSLRSASSKSNKLSANKYK